VRGFHQTGAETIFIREHEMQVADHCRNTILKARSRDSLDDIAAQVESRDHVEVVSAVGG
jgi:hypothetical protein